MKLLIRSFFDHIQRPSYSIPSRVFPIVMHFANRFFFSSAGVQRKPYKILDTDSKWRKCQRNWQTSVEYLVCCALCICPSENISINVCVHLKQIKIRYASNRKNGSANTKVNLKVLWLSFLHLQYDRVFVLRFIQSWAILDGIHYSFLLIGFNSQRCLQQMDFSCCCKINYSTHSISLKCDCCHWFGIFDGIVLISFPH